MSEIGTALPLTPVPVTTRTPPTSTPASSTTAMAELEIKLADALESLLPPGQTAKAEVISVKDQGQAFQLMLKLTLANGAQATLQAQSSQPISEGTSLAVTTMSSTQLLSVLQSSTSNSSALPSQVQTVLNSLEPDQFPAGTIIQGKVIATQEQALASTSKVIYKVAVDLMNTAMAGSRLNLETPLKLPVGSLLTARVDDAGSLAFLPLSNRLEQLDVEQQLVAQQSRQGSLDTLFRTLGTLAGTQALPENLKSTVDKLLADLPDMKKLADPVELAKALKNSGTLLEAQLVGGENTADDAKANLLRLVAQLSPLLGNPPDLAAGNLGQALPGLLRNALNALGGPVNPRQQALTFPLPARLRQSEEEEADLESLLKLAAAALSRLQTHQLSSLAQTQTTPEGLLLTTWQMELPMRDRQDVVPLQVKFQREESPSRQGSPERKETLWRIDLAFDIDPLGPLQVQAQLALGVLSSHLWAERSATAQLIGRELSTLRNRLVKAGLNVGDLDCRQGMPPRGPKAALEQRWVDEKA